MIKQKSTQFLAQCAKATCLASVVRVKIGNNKVSHDLIQGANNFAFQAVASIFPASWDSIAIIYMCLIRS